jgi:hypothetical protein
MIQYYFKFEELSKDVKALNKIRSNARLDCTAHTGNYEGLTKFINSHGHLALYKVQAREVVSTHYKRLAEWTLTNNNLNFSSIYIEELEYPQFAYGTPNKNAFIGKERKPNPLFAYRNDGYLFIINNDYSVIEVFVITDGRNLISSYYQHLIDGSFDIQINELRKQAKPFFNYAGLIVSSNQ